MIMRSAEYIVPVPLTQPVESTLLTSVASVPYQLSQTRLQLPLHLPLLSVALRLPLLSVALCLPLLSVAREFTL